MKYLFLLLLGFFLTLQVEVKAEVQVIDEVVVCDQISDLVIDQVYCLEVQNTIKTKIIQVNYSATHLGNESINLDAQKKGLNENLINEERRLSNLGKFNSNSNCNYTKTYLKKMQYMIHYGLRHPISEHKIV